MEIFDTSEIIACFLSSNFSGQNNAMANTRNWFVIPKIFQVE